MNEKLAPQQITERRNEIDLSAINYSNYSASELKQTDGILFPAWRIREMPVADQIALIRAQKVTTAKTGATSCSRLDKKGNIYDGWTYDAVPMTSWDKMLSRNAGIKEWTPYIVEGGLSSYCGAEVLYYDDILNLIKSYPYCVSEDAVDDLNAQLQIILDPEEIAIVKRIIRENYDCLTAELVKEQWTRLDKKQLLMSQAPINPKILRGLLKTNIVEHTLIWQYRNQSLAQSDIELYARTPSDWLYICMYMKLSPELMTKYRAELHLDFINYRLYSADDLLKTNYILFPVFNLRHYSSTDLLRLFRAKKITDSVEGGVLLDPDSYWHHFTNWAWPLTNASELADPTAPFEKQKPFILESNIDSYIGVTPLNYDHLIDLFEEKPTAFSVDRLERLLERGRLDVTNEEWDALIALISLSAITK